MIDGSDVWHQVKADIVPSADGYIVFDDTVLDKSHSRKINSVRWQYNGNLHKIVRGIGLLNCIYVNPETNQFCVLIIGFLILIKDGKTKITHMEEILTHLIHYKQLPFKTVLMDSWYANYQLMLDIHHLGKLFYCPLKKNCLARPLGADEKYQAVTELTWDEESLSAGQLI